MNLGRIFANAIARRVAYVVVPIALAWLGLGEARAHTDGVPCQGSYSGCTIQQAASAAHDRALGQAHCHAAWPNSTIETQTVSAPIPSGANAFRFSVSYTCRFAPPNQHHVQTVAGHVFLYSGTCPTASTLPELAWTGTGLDGSGNDTVCRDFCIYQGQGSCLSITIDGQAVTTCSEGWRSNGQYCSVAESPAPAPNDADGDGSSDENDLSPNNPGESGDGSGQDGSTACGGPGQPACAPDGSNEGSGRGNTSGGGGNCQTPPRSSGDAILAQIAFQTWATRCAIEGNANQGGGTGSDPGNGGDEGQPDWTKGDGPPVPADDTDYPAEQTRFGLGVSPDLLDEENIFGNASCPNFSITIWSQTVSTADFDGWCNLVVILRGLILIFGAFSALQILMGRGLV